MWRKMEAMGRRGWGGWGGGPRGFGGAGGPGGPGRGGFGDWGGFGDNFRIGRMLASGDLRLVWCGDAKRNGTRLDFTPEHGLPSNGNKYAAIQLSRKAGDVGREIYNLLAAAGLVVKTSKTPQEAVAAAEVEKPNARRGQSPKYFRHQRGIFSGNNGNMRAGLRRTLDS